MPSADAAPPNPTLHNEKCWHRREKWQREKDEQHVGGAPLEDGSQFVQPNGLFPNPMRHVL